MSAPTPPQTIIDCRGPQPRPKKLAPGTLEVTLARRTHLLEQHKFGAISKESVWEPRTNQP
eukprot:13452952-Alexandrium_andersonii.AAC.1